MKSMLFFMVLIFSLSSFAEVFRSDAVLVLQPGMVTVIDGEEYPIPGVETLELQGEVAENLFNRMNKVETTSYNNYCTLDNGEMLKVSVSVKSGATLTCEKWPKDCWGKDYYNCRANLDVATGEVRKQ